MRPPPVGGGYEKSKHEESTESESFNEAAARGRRIRGGPCGFHPLRPAASMRPPPVGGGYMIHTLLASTSGTRFNEAAARGRRIR